MSIPAAFLRARRRAYQAWHPAWAGNWFEDRGRIVSVDWKAGTVNMVWLRG